MHYPAVTTALAQLRCIIQEWRVRSRSRDVTQERRITDLIQLPAVRGGPKRGWPTPGVTKAMSVHLSHLNSGVFGHANRTEKLRA